MFKHNVLSRVYGKCVVSLRDFFFPFLPSHMDEELRTFVEQTMMVLPPEFPCEVDFTQVETHSSIVHGVVCELLRSSADNVLCNGLRLISHGDFECLWPNLALNSVRGRVWEQLHACIGSQMIRFLLLKTSLFTKLPNNSYMQVFGPMMMQTKTKDQLMTKDEWRSSVIRRTMFYNDSYIRKVGLGPKHVLSREDCSQNKRFVRELVRHIFRVDHGWRVPKHLRVMIDPMRKLIRNHHKLRYGHWLRVYCDLHINNKEDDSYQNLVRRFTPQHVVCKFVTTCVHRLVPNVMWGSENNKQLATQMVKSLICGGRYEEFDLNVWVNQWQTGRCKWLPRAANVKRVNMVRSWLRWLVVEVMMPLVRNHFYVTESSRNLMFYFRKPVWRKIVKTIDMNDMYQVQSDNTQAPPLRFVPKPSGVRPIANLSKKGSNNKSVNQSLRPAFEVLRWELQGNKNKQNNIVLNFLSIRSQAILVGRISVQPQRCVSQATALHFTLVATTSLLCFIGCETCF